MTNGLKQDSARAARGIGAWPADAILVTGLHLLLVVMQSVFAVWVALTPRADGEWAARADLS